MAFSGQPNSTEMLRKVRIALSAVFFIGITLLLVGIGQDWWGWMAKLQLLPAVCRVIGGFTLGNIAAVLGILLLTWVFGRIYCSVICPLGVMQDLVIFLRGHLGRKLRKKFSFHKPLTPLRWTLFAIFVASSVFATQLVISLVAPYSAYGRIVRAVAGQNVPLALALTAAVTFLTIVVCAWIWGRGWCNTVCPVGTLLGAVSSTSLFRISIDSEKCNGCKSCERGCKASCIDAANHKVDSSRCVDCFDCLDKCRQDAIGYRFNGLGRKSGDAAPSDPGRRAFIATSAVLATSLVAKGQEKKVDGGLAPVLPKQEPEREGRLVPPGSMSVKAFESRCTSCMLCVSACPNQVLRPGNLLEDALRPRMGYENGWCRPECTACSDVCPSGAIRPISREQKTLVKIGTARINPELCLAFRGEETCGNCAKRCPTGAITMVGNIREGNARPVVAEEQCIGCGACEYLCPSRPVSAITVDGIETHRTK